MSDRCAVWQMPICTVSDSRNMTTSLPGVEIFGRRRLYERSCAVSDCLRPLYKLSLRGFGFLARGFGIGQVLDSVNN
ncbi:uncharacterized protein LAESUDRAFT_720988 [Laetiporus sulphureus 93-53]|uniref:Uncharacterized protein n=1 Tax=Laetiporus sulphureus 93-53 TaxID=1314785 RepID=A0A165GPP6_9APHY|nr:uncharacterized protein LAESUDRAFT_720988 [Laetiporus sulphureus 93-53]KZT10636.1 hypothetical protein LAESUDRAFT_720988 [Laetiporus sulphureus 93-53]